MAIKLRSKREIEMLRRAGAIVADVLLKLQEQVRPEISTGELDEISSEMAECAGAVPLFRGVKGPYSKKAFPGSICASINEQVVHGIPSRKVRVKAGDVLSIDFGVKVDGYCGDAAVTVGVGEVSEDRQKLMDITQKLLDTAISRIAPGVKWSEIAGEMESCAASAGFSVVKDFVGHGIGTEMHEDPKVPNFVSKELRRNDIILKEGMVLAIEPMVNMGTSEVRTLKDGWVVVTKDGKCSAHFEHTVAVVKSGCEVLTVR